MQSRERLAISDLVVALTLAARRKEHELLGLQSEPWCWRRYPSGLGGDGVLRPDLFAVLGTSDYELRWFIEVDRGTEHLPTLIRKCRLYDAYYQSGIEQAQHRVFPRVAWLMSSPRRVEQLQRAIQKDRQLNPAMFTVALDRDAIAALTTAPD